jgi:eukaryotic-like serine/threonine-protein kinase
VRAKNSSIALGTSNAIRVAIHVGAALQQVHEKGYLHLDVKPTNVIVALGGRPVLYDFGCARRQSGARPRLITGTNPYIAPEECFQENATPAADVFGLGVTLYEMLTGKLPFALGKNRDDFPQTRMEAVPIRKHRPSISAVLSDLLLTCLGRDPATRPSLASLLPQLHEHIRTGPRMWPPGFRPDQEKTLRGKRA